MNSLTRSLPMAVIVLLLSVFTYAQNVTVDVNTSTRVASMDNGIISLTINSKGQVNSLWKDGVDLIDANNKGRFYFSYNDQSNYAELSPDAVRIEKQTDDYVELVYSNTSGNLHVEQAYILMSGVSGIYSYVTVKGTSSTINLREMRVVYRVSPQLFDYGYVTDAMQGYLPSVADMIAVNDNPIMDATYLMPDGTIYTKYNWANYIVRDSVHGIMSDQHGVWAIAPSNEFMNGGPMKQELTVHTTNKTPLVLQMLQGEHFGASKQPYGSGDEKIYGPFFIYVNSGDTHDDMIADAKSQASLQKSMWPYQWLENPLYSLERSEVSGQIEVPFGLSAENIQVVLAEPDKDIYKQGTAYMFWDQTDANGHFSIPDVRAGDYALYAYATEGDITDVLELDEFSVSGSNVNLGAIIWPVNRYKHQLWQIGENDRMTLGFAMSDSLREFGLYEIPPANLNFEIGVSNPETDWYYAQTKSGSWTITFDNNMDYAGDAVLTASIAGATSDPRVDIYVNGSKVGNWSFSNDATVYRSAVLSGRHEVRTITFPASELINGQNTIEFRMTSVGSRGGLMYDCIKLEAGEMLSSVENSQNPTSDAIINVYPNPFNLETNFQLSLSGKEKVKLAIYDLQGKLVSLVYDGELNSGKHEFPFNSISIPSGIYFYEISLDNEVHSGLIEKLD